MDRFDAMRVFVRVVERRSFKGAAEDLGLPPSTVSDAVKQIEARLGVRLLERTTRHVSPTLDGEAFHRRCVALIADLEDAEGAFGGIKPRGLVRIEVQGTLARHYLMPALPAFFAEYPDIEINMTEGDRWVDATREGVDCLLRYGALEDSEMVARKVMPLARATWAAPAYLGRHGVPGDLQALDGHRMVGIRTASNGRLTPLEFAVEGGMREVALPAALSVSGPESYKQATKLGLGLAQMPRFHVQDDVKRGLLVEVLPAMPPPSVPMSLMHPRGRQLSPRVRAFINWMVRELDRVR